MAPLPEIRFISRDRRQITRAPSSAESAPATTAAAASPIECPITAAGRTPRASIAAASATWTANIVGWIRSMPDSMPGAVIASVTENPDSCETTDSIFAIVSANTGSVRNSCVPISSHCEPCPEKTHTGP